MKICPNCNRESLYSGVSCDRCLNCKCEFVTRVTPDPLPVSLIEAAKEEEKSFMYTIGESEAPGKSYHMDTDFWDRFIFLMIATVLVAMIIGTTILITKAALEGMAP